MGDAEETEDVEIEEGEAAPAESKEAAAEDVQADAEDESAKRGREKADAEDSEREAKKVKTDESEGAAAAADDDAAGSADKDGKREHEDPEADNDRDLKKGRTEEDGTEKGTTDAAHKVGDIIQGKFGNGWFDCTVLEVGESKLKVKWKFDDSEAELSLEDIKREEKEDVVPVKAEVGLVLQGKFGNGWFECTVLEVGESKLKVKWKFDDSEAEISLQDVKAAEEKVEEPPSDEEEWKDSLKVQVGWEDAAWFRENDAAHLHKLEELAGVTAKCSEKGSLRMILREDAPGDAAWAERCAKAMCAFRAGTDLEVLESLPESSTKPVLTAIKVPDDFAKGHIRGKENARVLDYYRDYGVVIVFAVIGDPPPPEPTPEEKLAKIKVGSVIKGKFGNSFFDATVLEIVETKLKVKWKFDDSEAEVPIEDVQIDENAEQEQADMGPVDEGMEVEGKHGDSWHNATVVADGKSSIVVKWKHDDSTGVLKRNEVRHKPEKEPEPPPPECGPVEEGTEVEGKFEDGWHNATVIADGKSNIVCKWRHDESTVILKRSEVRLKHTEPEVPPEPVEPKTAVLIFGGNDVRSRLAVELKLLCAIEKKAEGFISKKDPRPSDEGDGIGFSVVELKQEGEFKGRIIGKGGAKLKTLQKVFEVDLDFIGKYAYILGIPEQRSRIVTMLPLLQARGDPFLPGVPEGLEKLCTTIQVPKGADTKLTSDKRAALNQVEDDTGTMVFFLGTSESASKPSDKVKLEEGVKLEAQSKTGDWAQAEILSIFRDDDDDADEGDTMVKVKYTADGSEALIPFARLRPSLEGDAADERRQSEQATKNKMTLFVVGRDEDRKTAEFKIMLHVEAAMPGSFSGAGDFVVKKLEKDPPVTADEAWKLQAAAGRRDNAARAAQCGALEVVGEAVLAVGDSASCDLALIFAKALLVDMPDSSFTDSLDDKHCQKALVPKNKRPNLTDQVITQLELDTHTFIYFDNGAASAGLEDEVRAVICGRSEAAMETAAAKLAELQEIEAEEKWEEKKEWEEEKKDGDEEKGEEKKDGDQKWDAKGDDKWWEKDDKKDEKKDDKKWEAKEDKWWEKSDDKKDDKKWESKEDKWWEAKDDKKDDKKWETKEDKWWEKKDDKKDDKKWESKEDKWWEKDDKKDDKKWEAKEDKWWEKKEDKKEDKWWEKDDKKEDKWWEKKDDRKDDKWWEKKEPEQKSDDKWRRDNKQEQAWGSKDQPAAASGAKRAWGESQPGASRPATGHRYQSVIEKEERRPARSAMPAAVQRVPPPRREDPVPSRRPAIGAAPGRAAGAPPWKAPRHEAPPPQEEAAEEEEDVEDEEAEEQADPKEVLAEMAFPKSIQEWDLVQDLVFAGHPPLPEGWIRAWSRSRNAVYYVRMVDNTSVFDISKVK